MLVCLRTCRLVLGPQNNKGSSVIHELRCSKLKSATIKFVLVFPHNVERIIINLVFKVFHAQQGDLPFVFLAHRVSASSWLLVLSVVRSKFQISRQSIVINTHSSAACFLLFSSLGMTVIVSPNSQARPSPTYSSPWSSRLSSHRTVMCPTNGERPKNKRNLLGDGGGRRRRLLPASLLGRRPRQLGMKMKLTDLSIISLVPITVNYTPDIYGLVHLSI